MQDGELPADLVNVQTMHPRRAKARHAQSLDVQRTWKIGNKIHADLVLWFKTNRDVPVAAFGPKRLYAHVAPANQVTGELKIVISADPDPRASTRHERVFMMLRWRQAGPKHDITVQVFRDKVQHYTAKHRGLDTRDLDVMLWLIFADYFRSEQGMDFVCGNS